MDSHHVIEIVIALCLVLGGASLLYALSERLRKFPFTFLLFAAGIGLSLLPMHAIDPIRLTPGLVMYIFLPALLFESAYNFELENFGKILAPGFWLASAGLVLSAFIIATPLSILLHIPFLEALLYGCVISSTDPIAVLTIFKQLGVPRRLQLLVDGESFLNDATSVIGFRIVLALIGTGTAAGFGPQKLGQSFADFVVVFAGGAVVGIVLGWAATQLIKRVQDTGPVAMTITVIMAHAVFIVADHFLKVSGIIAVLGAGIVLGNYGHDTLGKKTQEEMHIVWNYIVFVTVSLVFFLIGYEIDLARLWSNRGAIALATGALLVGRAVSVYAIGGAFNALARKGRRLPLSWLHIANWGGLRGVLPLVVILSLPDDFTHKQLFLDMVLGAILFTLVINALTIPMLIKWLGLSKSPATQRA